MQSRAHHRRQDFRHQDGQPPTRPAASNNSGFRQQRGGHEMETSETRLQRAELAAEEGGEEFLVEPEMDSRRERRKGKTRMGFISLFLHLLLFGQSENILLNFRRRRKSSRSDKIRFCLLFCLLMKLANGRSSGWIQPAEAQQEPMPLVESPYNYLSSEPQPLVYQSVHDFGSGDGPRAGHLSQGSSSSSSSSSSVSPSLVSAKCWNNYESDNDCKQINVITGNANGQPMAPDDDSIITPVVIFESSSTIEPFQSSSSARPQQPQVFLSPPYYEGSSDQQSAPAGAGHPTTASPSDVSLMPEYQPPSPEQHQTRWRPSSATEPALIGTTPMPPSAATGRPRGSQFVATPRPRKPLKSTTAGRRCRDEDDDDCDEPDDANDDGDDKEGAPGKRPSSSPADADSPELGSGLAPNDDNEDDPDDAEDSSEQAEISGNFDPTSSSPETNEDNQYGTRVTSGVHRPGLDEGTSSSSSPKQAGAEIEVLVHPTLPPLFPTTSTTTPSSAGLETQVSSRPVSVTSTPSTTTTSAAAATATATTTLTTTTTTMMPDDTYTSKPIFPSSTSPTTLSSADATSSLDPIDAVDSPPNPNNETSADLYKFVPMPLPTMEPPPRRVASANQSDSPGNSQEKVSEWNRFETSANERASPGRFGDFAWQQQQARQRPAPQVPSQLQPEPGPPPLSAGNSNAAVAQPVAREMLPQLLLYACLVVLIVTASIFIVMAFVLWRRNNARHRQLLLNKSAMLNGYAPAGAGGGVGGGGHLPASMSHASQLVANMQQQQPRLLGAYGSAAGANGLGKVTASIVEEDESASLLNNGAKEHGKGGGKYGGRGDASWTENSEPTTTSGESIKTGDSQQEQAEVLDLQQQHQLSTPYQDQAHQHQLQHQHQHQLQLQLQLQHQQRLPYPNSLSDGRQNSSSISDSSPIDGGAQMSQPQLQPPPLPPNQHYSPDPAHAPYPPPQVQPPHLQRSPMNFGGYQQQQHLGYHHQPALVGASKRFSASRSVEDLQPGAGYHHPASLNSQYPLPPSQPLAQQQHFYPRRPSQEAAFYTPPPPPRALAMNPLATLSRRYPLQRNIYSEDSSSFTMTASPSLARTSSSSSFAFNSSQVSSVRMKPLVDAAGRLFNDYTPTGASSYASGTGPPPPLLGRKERSEAWYV